MNTASTLIGARWHKLALSLVVSAGFLYLAFRNVPFDELGRALSQIDGRWVIVAIIVSFLMMIFRTWRWQLELLPLQHVPFGRLWVVTAVAYMAINVLPVRLGEVVRPWLLSRREPVSFSNVVGNLVIEKTMDSVAILFYILTGLLTVTNLPLWVRRGALFPAVGAGALVLLVTTMWWGGPAFVDRWVVRVLPARLEAGLMRILSAIIDGMRIIPNPPLLLSVFIITIALWFLPILSSYLIIVAFGLDVPFSAAVVVFIFIGFGTALPNVPGMIGPYQYACVLALGVFGITKVDALAYGLVLNAIQFSTLVLQGLVALPFAGVRVSDIRTISKGLRSKGLGG